MVVPLPARTRRPPPRRRLVLTALPTGLGEALTRLAHTRSLLVALDFDGTLAPIVDVPAEARALPEAQAAILRLVAARHTRVAVISGRALESLTAVADLPERIDLVGSHGVELRLDGTRSVVTLSDVERVRLGQLRQVVGEVAKSFDGVWLELKPAGVAMHTRLAAAADGRAAMREAAQRSAEIPDITTRHGSAVVEFSVRAGDKGEAIDRLRLHTDATAILFAGDDVTDEDAFAALQPADLGLKVGAGPTRAGFRVPGAADVARVLELLADLRGD